MRWKGRETNQICCLVCALQDPPVEEDGLRLWRQLPQVIGHQKRLQHDGKVKGKRSSLLFDDDYYYTF